MALGISRDMEDLALEALGLGVTAYVNNNWVAPFVSRLVPSITAGKGLATKLFDAATTWVSAIGVGEGVGLASKPVGKSMERGGKILAAGKVVSAFLPGYSLQASLTLGAMGMPAAAVATLPAPSTAAASMSGPGVNLSPAGNAGPNPNYPQAISSMNVGL